MNPFSTVWRLIDRVLNATGLSGWGWPEGHDFFGNERKPPKAAWPSYMQDWPYVVVLGRQSWLHYADPPLAPTCRSRTGSYMAVGDSCGSAEIDHGSSTGHCGPGEGTPIGHSDDRCRTPRWPADPSAYARDSGTSFASEEIGMTQWSPYPEPAFGAINFDGRPTLWVEPHPLTRDFEGHHLDGNLGLSGMDVNPFDT